MQNMIAYAGTELRTFLQLPFSEVDSLVLAQLSDEKLERLPKGLFDCANPVTIAELNKAELFHDLFTGVRDEPDNVHAFGLFLSFSRFSGFRFNVNHGVGVSLSRQHERFARPFVGYIRTKIDSINLIFCKVEVHVDLDRGRGRNDFPVRRVFHGFS